MQSAGHHTTRVAGLTMKAACPSSVIALQAMDQELSFNFTEMTKVHKLETQL